MAGLPVKFHGDVRIKMDDGVELSAGLWLPEGCKPGSLPCVIDMIPYRGHDLMAARDQSIYPPLAAQGFACLRLDVRGTGESGGILDGEYTERQIQDSLRAVEWAAAQGWSNGKVGIMGNSWGGFAALGALKAGHKNLKAGIVSCASDDCHTDDAHFESGVILSENLIWGMNLTSLAALPPDPRLSAKRGEDWEAIWRARLEAVIPYPSEWIDRRGNREYAETRNFRNLDDAAAPVLLTGGWLDAYARGQWRLGGTLSDESRTIFGGGAHGFPDQVRPDLCVEFGKIAGQWLGQHLKNEPGKPAAPLPDLSFIYTHVPSAEDARAEGYWIELPDRRQNTPVTLPAPAMTHAPAANSQNGFIKSFGKWCPGGDGSDEAETYPSTPDAERDNSWVYRYPAFEKETVMLGAPALEIRDPAGFAGGVYLARLFLCRDGDVPKRIGYAVIDGRTGAEHGRIQFSPYGVEAQTGDHLEVHIMPQAFPLLWAPGPNRPLPEHLLGDITLPQPAGFKKADWIKTPPAPMPAPATGTATTYEEKDGWQFLRVVSPYAETTSADNVVMGDGQEQAYEYGAGGGDMKATIKTRMRMKWPESEDIIVDTAMTAQSDGADMLLKTKITATRNGAVFFEKSFDRRHAGALLPPAYDDAVYFRSLENAAPQNRPSLPKKRHYHP